MRYALLFSILLLSIFFSGCISLLKKESDCTPSKAGDLNECYANVALRYAIVDKDQTNAIRMCNKIDEIGSVFIGSEKDNCIMDVAEVLDKPALCGSIGNTVTKRLCERKSTPLPAPTLCSTVFILPLLSILALFAYYRKS